MTGSEFDLLQSAINFIDNFSSNFANIDVGSIDDGITLIIKVFSIIMLHLETAGALEKVQDWKKKLLAMHSDIKDLNSFYPIIPQTKIDAWKNALHHSLTGIKAVLVAVKAIEFEHKQSQLRNNPTTPTLFFNKLAICSSSRASSSSPGESSRNIELKPLSPIMQTQQASSSTHQVSKIEKDEINVYRVRTF
ncbi:MAG: hypothetical protein WCW01_05565 [Gammaproteobacteria bacterium]